MSEFLIIMKKGATKEQINRVIKEVQSNKGKLQQRYPPQIIIGRDGEDIKIRLTNPKLEGVSAVYLSDKDPPELGLDKVGSLGLGKVGSSAVRAWIVSNSKEYREKKAARRIEGLRVQDFDAVSLGATQAMKGTAAVGIIIVGGPQGTDAEFTSGEEETVNTEVKYGTTQLANLANNHSTDLSFVPDHQRVDLPDSPDTVKDESGWRDAALAKLGFTTEDPIQEYLDDLKKKTASDCAYIAFFTKYKTSFNNMPFYHQVGASYCVLRYPQPGANGKYMAYTGHPPDDLDILFAHETGHVFGAVHDNMAVTCLMSPNIDWKVCPTTATAFQWNA